MKNFRAGKFARGEAPRVLRKFCPDLSKNSILEIDLQELADNQKSLILLDVDNTVVAWRSEELPQSSIDWVQRVKDLGMTVCLLSNTRNPERLKRIAERLGVDYLYGTFKPSPKLYLQALDQYKTSADAAIMIGDQLMTDILGANRSGIQAIWVRPMANKEFIGTKANRLIERGILTRLYKTMEEEGDDFPVVEKTGIFQLKVVRQFAKFCVVGGSSFLIDNVIRYVLLFIVPYGDQKLGEVVGTAMSNHFPQLFAHPVRITDPAVPVVASIAGVVAILNSFYWNRKWTFDIAGSAQRKEQFRRFFVLSLSVLVLNTILTTLFNHLIPGHAKLSLVLATFLATLIGAVCNFLGQRYWAFHTKEPK